MDISLEAVGEELAAGVVQRNRQLLDIYEPSSSTGPERPPAWS